VPSGIGANVSGSLFSPSNIAIVLDFLSRPIWCTAILPLTKNARTFSSCRIAGAYA
jgi:hypothetical protein